MKISYYLKDKCKIYISVHISGERLPIATGQKVPGKTFFNGKRVIGEAPFKDQINAFLTAKELKLKKIESDAAHLNIKLTKEYVKQKYNEYDDPIVPMTITKPLETSDSFFKDFDRFISETDEGERLTDEGKQIGKRAIQLYRTTKDHLANFSKKKGYRLTYKTINKDFYKQFTDFLWDDLNHFDNTVGNSIKVLKTFLSWSGKTDEHNKKYFRKYSEEKDIIVLTPDQLNQVIDSVINEERVRQYFKDNEIPFIEGRLYMTIEMLQRTKDTFILGCITTLRVSDLLKLRQGYNLIKADNYKIKVFSTVKTGASVLIDLPPFACEIIDKYLGQYKTVLPPISDQKFNENLKVLGAFLGWNKQYVGYFRYKRKQPIEVVEPLSDLMETHLMRRTGITTLLIAGMKPMAVKQISGHSNNSRSFEKYVRFSEAYINTEYLSAWENVRNMGKDKPVMKIG